MSPLQVFKLSVSNASALADWEGFEPCKKEWFGVNCGESTRSKHRWAVVSIELPNCNLGGEIPEAIGDLVELTKLNLRNNNFTGLLPASLSRLTALESLDVSGNPFEVAPSTNLTAGAPPPLTSDPISIIPEPDAPGPKIPGLSPSTNSIALYVGLAAGVVVAFLLGVALVLLYIYLRRRRAETKDFAPIKDVAAGADGRGEDYGTSGAVAAAGYAAGKAGKRGGGGVFGRLWPGTGKVADLGTVSAYQQQAHVPAAPSAAVPAHDHGANLLPPHDPSAMIPHSGASNHSGWGAAVSAVHSGVNSAAHSGVQSVTVEGGAASPYAPASAYASAAEPGSNMSSQFPSRTPSQTPSQPMSHVAGPGLAAAIAAEAGGGIGGGEGGSGGAGGGYAAHSSNSSAQTPGASVGSLKSGRNMAEYRLMLPGRSLSNTVMELTYEDVLGATDNLAEANVIGSGGFGRVYCGRLAGAGVAVKVLEAGSSQGDREFQAEVELLSRLRSPHLVHLVGYCMAGGNRVLVYNLMANGSLSDLLHDNSSDGSFVQRFGRERPQVEWQQRMQIALDAARGLMFLHHAATPAVIHRDFKSSNVLVDHDFHARIADFGLARDGPSGEKRWVSTRVLGTTGYLSPEYVTTGRLTPKSDVYSFGIVLLELLTGLTPIDHDRPLNRVSLTSWALPLLTQRERLGELLDPRLDGTVPLHEFMQVGGMWAAGGWGLDACGGCIGAKKRRDMQGMVHIGVQGMVHIAVGRAVTPGGVSGSGVRVRAGRPTLQAHMDHVVQSLMPLCKAAISPPHPPPFLACPHPLSASLHQAASVAAVCLQADPDYRPHMDDVVQSLMPLCKAAISPYASPAQSNHSSLR
ncbi:unnamed protein product [Closterium sp. NIES-65]|nr:unnamed protein product [Closterium sp. NIES-65]